MKRVSVFIAVAFVAIFVASINTIAEEPEYESPEIQLKFNLKGENDALWPQTKLPNEEPTTKPVTADITWDLGPAGKIGRDPVNVGTWTSNPVEFDLSITINSFDVWWEDTEDENGDDTCEWTITIEHNGNDVSEDTSGCQHDGSELAKTAMVPGPQSYHKQAPPKQVARPKSQGKMSPAASAAIAQAQQAQRNRKRP